MTRTIQRKSGHDAMPHFSNRVPAISTPATQNANSAVTGWRLAIFCIAAAFNAGIGASVFSGSESEEFVAPLLSYEWIYNLGGRLFLILSIATLLWRQWDWAQLLLRAWPILLASLIIGLTTLWSLDPQRTFLRFSHLAVTMLFIAGLVSRYGLPGLTSMFRALGWTMFLLNVLLLVEQPPFAFNQDDYAGIFRGLFVHKNVLGRFYVGVVVCVTPALLVRRPGIAHLFDVLLIALSLITIFISQSATSLVIAICAIIYILFLWIISRIDLPHPHRIVILAIISLLSLMAMTLQLDALLVLLGRDATLTGRVALWETLWNVIQEQPWLGSGFGAFWDSDRGADIAARIGWSPSHAHNGYIENWLEGGAFLVILNLASIAMLLRNGITRLLRGISATSAFVSAIAITFPVYNLLEAIYIRDKSAPTMLVIAALLISLKALRETPAAAHLPGRAANSVARSNLSGRG